MSEFDVDAMLARFRDRAEAAKDRPMPPVTGEGRREFQRQRGTDFTDYSIVGAAEWTIDDGWLVLRVDMRPPDEQRDQA